MTNIDFSEATLSRLITHNVGNKLRDESYKLSSKESLIQNETENFLLKYFLYSLKTEEMYNFSHSVELEMNEIYSIVNKLFSNSDNFITNSQNIAKLLYEKSMHPKIKEGQLNVCLFANVLIDGQRINALGIFKSETNSPFIQMNQIEDKFEIRHDFGFEIKGVDKGCFIFDTDYENGYKVLVFDGTTKNGDAQYWKENFLNVKVSKSEYHQTNQFLSLTKNYVTQKLDSDFEVSKADKVDLLNRSVNYFKTHDSFDKQDFEKQVFVNDGVIESFRKFNQVYRAENDVDLSDNFDISSSAVKKQSRAFKNVVKLDKNFHIYIHGNRELLEQGVDENGRKFYKLYYQSEE